MKLEQPKRNRRKGESITEEERNIARTLRAQGQVLDAIAIALGRAKSTIYWMLRENGVDERRRLRRSYLE